VANQISVLNNRYISIKGVKMRLSKFIAFIAYLLFSPISQASNFDGFQGDWMTAQNDAVISFGPCPDAPSALCGIIVWDKESVTKPELCGMRVAQLSTYASSSWRDGWIFDPRDGKKYRGIARIQGAKLLLRAYVGTEMLGQTEQLRQVTAIPTTPSCKK
jgi:uncharacterized protein (DUF2147 family)